MNIKIIKILPIITILLLITGVGCSNFNDQQDNNKQQKIIQQMEDRIKELENTTGILENNPQEIISESDTDANTSKLLEITQLRQEVEKLKNRTVPDSPIQTKPLVQIKQNTILSNSEIINKVKPATVFIETTIGSGSGMIIDEDGYILTNAHVLWDVSSAKIKLSDGRSFSAKIIGRDENVDLAILKIVGDNLPKVNFGDSNNVIQGDDVFTLGYPFGLEGDVSFKEGTISRRISDDDATYLETSAEIHPGNSGGPLVNQYGEIIGINTASYGDSISGINIGETIKLAIPINVAKNLIPELKNGREVIIDHKQLIDTYVDKPSLEISNIQAIPTINSINFKWQTNYPTTGYVTIWPVATGSGSYDFESNNRKQEHEISTNEVLTSGKEYSYIITVTDVNDNKTSTEERKVNTPVDERLSISCEYSVYDYEGYWCILPYQECLPSTLSRLEAEIESLKKQLCQRDTSGNIGDCSETPSRRDFIASYIDEADTCRNHIAEYDEKKQNYDACIIEQKAKREKDEKECLDFKYRR